MEKYNNLLKNITELIEKGLFNSKDFKRDLESMISLNVQILTNKLNLVSREEFEVQKKMLEKLRNDLKNIKKKKKLKR
jgi:BMFP domain-containing protein YqiC